MSDGYEVTIVDDRRGLDAVAQFRYRVYCEQMNLMRDLADHEARTLHLPGDDESIIVVAQKGAEVVGTLRVMPGPLAREDPFDIDCYALRALDGVIDAEAYTVADRFMISPEHRSGLLTGELMLTGLAEVVQSGASIVFASCEPHLLGLYTAFGFVPYKQLYSQGEGDLLVPMILIIDHDHLSGLGSSTAEFLPPETKAPIPPVTIVQAFGSAPAVRAVAGSTIDELEALAASGASPGMLDGLTADELGMVAERGTEMNVAAGDPLIRAGRSAQTLFVILDGACEVRRDGRLVAVVGRGDVLGEMAFLLEDERSSDVIAATEVRAVAFRTSALRKLIEEADPVAVKLLLNLARVLASRLDGAGDAG